MLARALRGLAGGCFWIGQEREHHGPGAGRGIGGLMLVTADQLLLVSDKPARFLASEGEPGALRGPTVPTAHPRAHAASKGPGSS
jgi:hypothetical protein